MKIPSDFRKLAQLFEKFGARDAELWAGSQIREGIPQLQRFLFLRQAWRNVLEDENVAWIEHEVREAERYPSGPYAGVGAALKRWGTGEKCARDSQGARRQIGL